MKKLLILTFVLLIGFSTTAQEKCYCKLVSNYTSLAKTVRSELGEEKRQVQAGQELFLKMSPAAHWNTKENGGCRLRAGEWYVADRNGNPIRAWDCGNSITSYTFYVVGSTTYTGTTTTHIPNAGGSETTIIINNNCSTCPDGKKPDPDLPVDNSSLFGTTTGNTGYYGRIAQPNPLPDYNSGFDQVVVYDKKTGKWWKWIVYPIAGAALSYVIWDGVSDGEWFDFNGTKRRTITVDGPPGGPDLNPSGINLGLHINQSQFGGMNYGVGMTINLGG